MRNLAGPLRVNALGFTWIETLERLGKSSALILELFLVRIPLPPTHREMI